MGESGRDQVIIEWFPVNGLVNECVVDQLPSRLLVNGSVSTLNVVCGQQLVDSWSGRRSRLRGKEVPNWQVHRERGSQEVSKKPQNTMSGYAGPARVRCWEVTRRRDKSVVHRQAITRERTANTR